MKRDLRSHHQRDERSIMPVGLRDAEKKVPVGGFISRLGIVRDSAQQLVFLLGSTESAIFHAGKEEGNRAGMEPRPPESAEMILSNLEKLLEDALQVAAVTYERL